MNGVTSSGYLRYPHIHGDLLVFVAEDDVWLPPPHIHGDLLFFVAEDDVWLAPADGGRAWKLSADSAQVSFPRFSPDGSAIAWTGWRDGNSEVYLADPEGNAATRLTYWGDN